MNDKASTLERTVWRGWVETKLALLLSPYNLSSTLFPLFEKSYLIPLLSWIPVVMLLKDDSVWFPKKTCWHEEACMFPVGQQGMLKALFAGQRSYKILSIWEETWKTYLLAKVCCLASRITFLTDCATLVALAWVAHLSTVTINRAGLVASLASCALLAAVTLAVLVTPEVCCAVLLTVATAAVLIALLFGSDYHLLASTQLSDKNKVEI